MNRIKILSARASNKLVKYIRQETEPVGKDGMLIMHYSYHRTYEDAEKGIKKIKPETRRYPPGMWHPSHAWNG